MLRECCKGANFWFKTNQKSIREKYPEKIKLLKMTYMLKTVGLRKY